VKVISVSMPEISECFPENFPYWCNRHHSLRKKNHFHIYSSSDVSSHHFHLQPRPGQEWKFIILSTD